MAETVRNCNGSEGKEMLSSPLQLKGLISHTDKCPPRKLHCSKTSPRETPECCPGHSQTRYVHVDSYFVLKLSQGWRITLTSCVTEPGCPEKCLLNSQEWGDPFLIFISIIISLAWKSVLVNECPDGVASMKCPSKGQNSSRYFVMI